MRRLPALERLLQSSCGAGDAMVVPFRRHLWLIKALLHEL